MKKLDPEDIKKIDEEERKECEGVDLNRNFPYEWASGPLTKDKKEIVSMDECAWCLAKLL